MGGDRLEDAGAVPVPALARSMWGRCGRLGRAAGALVSQSPALEAGAGQGLPGLARRHRQTSLLRVESAAGDRPLRGSGYRKTKQLFVCHFCTTEDHNVSYKELKDLLDSKAISLIDVREKWEIGQYGKIPGSICIPLGEVEEALQMNPAHFKEKYNEDMPSKSDHLVFSCLAGVRSKQALVVAKFLGFSRVQHYAGGFKEWAEYETSEKK